MWELQSTRERYADQKCRRRRNELLLLHILPTPLESIKESHAVKCAGGDETLVQACPKEEYQRNLNDKGIRLTDRIRPPLRETGGTYGSKSTAKSRHHTIR